MKFERMGQLSCGALAVVGVMGLGASDAFAQAPKAVDYGISLNEDSAIATPLRATDVATNQPITPDSACNTGDGTPADCIILRPQHGNLTGVAPGLSYKPDDDFYGTDTFTYRVARNGTNSTNTATVTITVNAVDDKPEIEDPGMIILDEDTTHMITVNASDPDDLDPNNPPDIMLTYNVSVAPTKGSLNTLMGRQLAYTPNTNFTGNDQFTVRVTDPEGNEDTQQFRLTISPVNDAPTAMDQMVSGQEDTPINIFLMAMDVDANDTLMYSVVDMPSNGTVSGNGASATYTPGPDFTGTDSFTWRVTDSQGAMSAPATVSIVIGNANDPPVFTGMTPSDGDVVAGNEGTTIAFTATAMDADMDNLTFSLMGLADLDGATFDASTGEFSWPVNWRHVGEYDVILSVTDNASNEVQRSIKIRVNRVDTDNDGLQDTFETEIGTNPMSADSDMDTISDRDEINLAMMMAVDTNGNGIIDALDTDSDGDGVADRDEVQDADLITVPEDSDGDGKPNFQDEDSDGDTAADKTDNCYLIKNTDQLDTDQDGLGDVCDEDLDNDGVANIVDACPATPAPGQASGCLPAPEPEPEGRCAAASVSAPVGSNETGGLMLLLLGFLVGLRRRR